jgi:predicted alpha/beta-hydrolase family hydrolase
MFRPINRLFCTAVLLYMAARRTTGKRRPPDREPIWRDTWHRVIDSLSTDRVVIGGKSMGGRIASLVADEAQVAGLVDTVLPG